MRNAHKAVSIPSPMSIPILIEFQFYHVSRGYHSDWSRQGIFSRNLFWPCKPLRASSWKKNTEPTSAFRKFSLPPMKNWAVSSESSLFCQGLTFYSCYRSLKQGRLFSDKTLCLLSPIVLTITMNLYSNWNYFIWRSAWVSTYQPWLLNE